MKLIAKTVSLSLVGVFMLCSAPAFAGNYCPILLNTERQYCRNDEATCIKSGQEPSVCSAELESCFAVAQSDYLDCLGVSTPPPCSGPLCGVSYKLKARETNFNLNRINIVLEPAHSVVKKS